MKGSVLRALVPKATYPEGDWRARSLFKKVKPSTFLQAVDGAGRTLWEDSVCGMVTDVAVSHDGRSIAAVTFGGIVYCYDREGVVRWTYPPRQKASGRTTTVFSAAIPRRGGTILLGTSHGIVCLAETSEKLWEWNPKGGFGSSAGPLDVDTNGLLIAVHVPVSSLTVLSGSGEERWSFRPKSLWERFHHPQASISPEGRDCAAAWTNEIRMFDLNGTIRWTRKLDGNVTCIARDALERVFARTNKGSLHCLDSRGKPLWNIPVKGGRGKIAVVHPGTGVFLAETERRGLKSKNDVVKVDSRGKHLWSANIEGKPMRFTKLACSAGGEVVACSFVQGWPTDREKVIVLDRDGRLIARFAKRGDWATVAVSADGSTIVGGSLLVPSD